jgi:hypothetical protein
LQYKLRVRKRELDYKYKFYQNSFYGSGCGGGSSGNSYWSLVDQKLKCSHTISPPSLQIINNNRSVLLDSEHIQFANSTNEHYADIRPREITLQDTIGNKTLLKDNELSISSLVGTTTVASTGINTSNITADVIDATSVLNAGSINTPVLSEYFIGDVTDGLSVYPRGIQAYLNNNIIAEHNENTVLHSYDANNTYLSSGHMTMVGSELHIYSKKNAQYNGVVILSPLSVSSLQCQSINNANYITTLNCNAALLTSTDIDTQTVDASLIRTGTLEVSLLSIFTRMPRSAYDWYLPYANGTGNSGVYPSTSNTNLIMTTCINNSQPVFSIDTVNRYFIFTKITDMSSVILSCSWRCTLSADTTLAWYVDVFNASNVLQSSNTGNSSGTVGRNRTLDFIVTLRHQWRFRIVVRPSAQVSISSVYEASVINYAHTI